MKQTYYIILILLSVQACRTKPTPLPTQNSTIPATPRTILSNVIHVSSAIANDDNDDTEYLLQVFDSLKPNQHLVFPAGTYILSRPLNIRAAGVKVSGQGGSTTLFFRNEFDLYAEFQSRVGMINILSDNVTIEDMRFDQNFRQSGKSDGDKPNVGCIIIGGKYLKPNSAPISTKGLKISGCIIYDHYGDAISAYNAPTHDLIVSNNHLISAYIAGNWIEADANHNEQGISIQSGSNILISDNTIEGALDDPIATHVNVTDVNILNNTITTTGGRILIAGTTNCLVANNEITYIQDGSSAIWITHECQAQAPVLSNNIKIINNTIRVNENVKTGYLIRLFGAGNNILIEGNKLYSSGAGTVGNGIQINDRPNRNTGQYHSGKGVVIINNIIDNCHWPITVGGFHPDNNLEPSDYAIANNTISRIRNQFNRDITILPARTRYTWLPDEDPCRARPH